MTLTPPSDPSWHIPQFNLRIEDLAHPGVAVFLGAVGNNTAATLRTAVLSSFKWLYSPQTVPRNVQSIELVLRAMNGVATASGNAEHKKIHFSLDYIRDTADRAHDEILGVLTHEVVHCYQYTAQGTCPPGFVEGIAGKFPQGAHFSICALPHLYGRLRASPRRARTPALAEVWWA
jgi:hypothetical protein